MADVELKWMSLCLQRKKERGVRALPRHRRPLRRRREDGGGVLQVNRGLHRTSKAAQREGGLQRQGDGSEGRSEGREELWGYWGRGPVGHRRRHAMAEVG